MKRGGCITAVNHQASRLCSCFSSCSSSTLAVQEKQRLASSESLMLGFIPHGLRSAVVQEPQMCSHCRHCDHNAMEILGNLCIWDVLFFSVRLGVKSPSAVNFSVSTNIDPHAACALFRPALHWILQQNDRVCCDTCEREAINYFI